LRRCREKNPCAESAKSAADLVNTAAVAEKLGELVASTLFETSAGALSAKVSMGVEIGLFVIGYPCRMQKGNAPM
jgi:hypothetical protein